MKRSLIAALAVFLVALLSGGEAAARAKQNSLGARLEAWADEQSVTGGVSYSGVFFDRGYYEDFFGKEWFPLLRFHGGWAPIENLYLGWSVGGMFETGRAIGELTGERGEARVQLYVLPVQLNLRYRFKFMDNQAVVPSVWVGYDWWRFQERVDREDDLDGDKTGWHWGADLAFLLDLLDPDAAAGMKRDFGITDTYLFLGYEQMQVGRDERGFDFSGAVFMVGLRFDVEAR